LFFCAVDRRAGALPKHIVATRISSRLLLPPLEKIEAAIVTIEFLSSRGTSSSISSPQNTSGASPEIDLCAPSPE
jgi:hypothetical protein